MLVTAPREARQARGDETRAGADLEHAIVGTEVERLQHAAFDGRLHHRLAVADRQRHVGERERCDSAPARNPRGAPRQARRARADRELPRVAPGSRSCSAWRLGIGQHGWVDLAESGAQTKRGKSIGTRTSCPANLHSLPRPVVPKCRKSPRPATPYAATIRFGRRRASRALRRAAAARAARARRARTSMRANARSTSLPTRESPVASSSESQSASRARSSADSADSVRRAAERSCARGIRRRAVRCSIDAANARCARAMRGSRVEIEPIRPLRARTGSWLHSARSRGLRYRMRDQGKKLHGLASSKGCASGRERERRRARADGRLDRLN